MTTDPRLAWLAEIPPAHLAAITGPNGPIPPPERTLGPAWCKWIETNCRMGEGDMYGQAPAITPFQRALLWKLGEIDDDGERVYGFALITFGKGGGKSPMGGWLGSLDLAGPSVVCDGCEKCDYSCWLPSGRPHAVKRTSPDVLVLASSMDQAALIMDEIRTTFLEGPLAEHATVLKTVVELQNEHGTAQRRAATPKQTDGSKATTLLVDEVHEFSTDAKETAYHTAAGGTAKRRNSLTVMFSTAGFDLNSMFGKKFSAGKRGEFTDEELFVNITAEDGLDPTNDEDIAKGILQANPLAAAGIASVRRLVTKFKEMPYYRAKRYFWNLWVASDESWLPHGAWENCKSLTKLELDPSLPIWVGGDMAKNRDSAAIVTLQRRADGRLLALSKIWFPDGNLIDQSECDDYLRFLCAAYEVQWIAADENYWVTLSELEKGDPDKGVAPLPIFRMPQNGKHMITAYSKTRANICDGIIIHDGSPDFSDQVASAVPHDSDGGWTLKKGKQKRRIDSCPALAGAVFASTQPREVEKPAPEFYVI
jgi:phage terminase large subunit-like protein